MRRSCLIPYGHEAEHAAALARGLSRLRRDFIGQVCPVCAGQGTYRQTYTAGCGGGHFSMPGPCDCCGETGLMQNGRPAPDSVVHQVLVAASDGGGHGH